MPAGGISGEKHSLAWPEWLRWQARKRCLQVEFGKLKKRSLFFFTFRGPGRSVRCHLDFLGEACSSPGVGTSIFIYFL